MGASVGLRTINERINQLEARLAQVHREPIEDVPAVVQLDGIWLSMQTQQDGLYEHSRQRKRRRTSGKRIVVLVALGLWTDGSGKRHILDWEIADQEEQAAWERLVQRLWERGVKEKSPSWSKLRRSIKPPVHQRRESDSPHLPNTGGRRSHRRSPPLSGSFSRPSATIRCRGKGAKGGGPPARGEQPTPNSAPRV